MNDADDEEGDVKGQIDGGTESRRLHANGEESENGDQLRTRGAECAPFQVNILDIRGGVHDALL